MTRSRPGSVRTATLALASAVLALLAVPATAEAAPAPTVLLPTAATATAAPTAGSDAVWTRVAARSLPSDATVDRRVEPSRFAAYDLDLGALQGRLDRAPAESARGAGSVLSVPAPNGDLVDFRIVESPIMQRGLAAAHPEITTYAGRSVDGAASIRLDVTPMGFHASVRGDGGAWYVDPAYNGRADGPYLSYLGTDLPQEAPLTEPEEMADELAHGAAGRAGRAGTAPSAGEAQGATVTIRSYRLALVTDPSYARYFGTENVLAEKVTLMNRVNQIYNDDFAVRLVLIDETDELNLDSDAKAFGPDGGCGSAGCFLPNQFANGCAGSLLNRNRIALGQLVGASKYDIGHVMLGINGGGIAGLGVVGGDGKARGCTGLPQPEGDFMAIDYVAHEMGHQFGGNHTFNGTEWNCGGNKAAPSVEPGSGSSVMAYAGICQQDNLQPHTDPYFSQWSQQEMTAYIVSDRNPINEVQTVSLNGFDQDGEAFTLSYGGRTTAPIVRGTNYTAAGIKAALEAVLDGGTVTVAPFGGATNPPTEITDTGFQLAFNTPAGQPMPNPLAGQDLAPVTIAFLDAGATGFVGETAKGGPIQNKGFVLETASNRTPVVTAPATASIPLRTPFALTGEATDPDGDQLIYLWEQADRGAGTGTALVSQTKTNGPLFRVFGTYADVSPAATLLYHSPGENLANGDPTRTFPDMEQILVGNTNAATGTCPEAPAKPATGGATNVPVPTIECFSEWLPTADYVGSVQAGNLEPSLNFRFTARDLDPVAGGYSFANTKVLVDKTAGPFLVSSKNVAAAAVAGRSEVVTWAVAGTNKPTLAENVKISLSTDGGRSYPIVLAASTANDGSEPVTWPNVATSTARIKVEAVGNVFFDVNNADFQIVPRLLVDGPAAASYDVDYSDALEGVGLAVESGSVDGDTITATATGLPEGLSLATTETSADGVRPATAAFTVTGTVADEPGTYPVTVVVSDGTTPVTRTFDVIVTPETATPAYTGPDAVTVGPGDEVTVTATVVPEDDGTAGDLSTATLTFADVTTGDKLCEDAPVATSGKSTCTFTPSVQDGGRTYAVGLAVGGRYTGSAETAAPLVVVVEDAPVDTTAPETTIASGPGIVIIATSTRVVVDTEDGADVACTLDGAPVDCAGGTAVLTGLAAGTHVFEAAATDAAGNTDASPATRTFTVPVDDRGLAVTKPTWSRAAGNRAFERTLSTTRTKGAQLSVQGTDVRGVFLVARRSPGSGRVSVFMGKRLLRTVSLGAAGTQHRAGIPVAVLPADLGARTFRIRTLDGKPVAVDALALVTDPPPTAPAAARPGRP